MRKIIAAILLFTLPSLAQAEPKKHWYKDPKVLLVIGAAIASSAVATHEIHDCRAKGRIELCPGGGYGPFPAREGARAGMTFTLAGVSLGMRHNGWKEWVLPSLVATGINTFAAVSAARKNIPLSTKKD
jgi:hypothetical protein